MFCFRRLAADLARPSARDEAVLTLHGWLSANADGDADGNADGTDAGAARAARARRALAQWREPSAAERVRLRRESCVQCRVAAQQRSQRL